MTSSASTAEAASFIPAGSTVLLTGINGFLGSRLALDLLERGFAVRGVVRAQSKAAEVQAIIPAQYQPCLSFVVVDDFLKPDAFDGRTFEGVAAAIHCASPQDLSNWMGAATLIDTTVDCTMNLLRSAAKTPTVRRVIYISSLAAVHGVGEGMRPEKPFTEEDWNTISREAAYSTDSPFVAYFAAKTFAERAAWAFAGNSSRGQANAGGSEAKEVPSFDLVTFVFAAIFGPTLIKPRSLAELPSSLGYLRGAMDGTGPLPSGSFVDVRDLSAAIVTSLQEAKAGGERFIVAAGDASVEEVQSLKRAAYVDKPVEACSIDASKARRLLHFAPRSKAETLNDTKRFMDEVAAQSAEQK